MPPPKSSLTSFAAGAEAESEVICPLRNQDGSRCAKKCLGGHRYRSIIEHIRRAHPAHYLSKLPATKDSFELMISTPPHAVEPAPQKSPIEKHRQRLSDHSVNLDNTPLGSYQHTYGHVLNHHDTGYYGDAEAATIFNSMQAQARSSDEFRRGSLIPAASAAQVLAQLHYHKAPDSDWGGDDIGQNFYTDRSHDLKNQFVDPQLEEPGFMQDNFPPPSGPRSPSHPPIQRSLSGPKLNRPRKSSLSQARLAKHERKRSRDIKRNSGENHANAAIYGKRWEDLLEAATSATEDSRDRDLTPIPASPANNDFQPNSRTSLPPFALGSQFQSYTASPLNRILTPPPPDPGLELHPFPSVESSISSHQHNNSADSGAQFQIMNPSDSSPLFSTAADSQHVGAPVQLYCAGCKKLNNLTDSFACTNCICGLCRTCVEALVDNQRNGRLSACPKCQMNYVTFKPFQLDLR